MLDTTALHAAQSGAPAEYWRFEGFTLDVPGRVLSDPSGREVPLTRSEFELLRAFLASPGRVLSRDHLLDAVAGRRAEAYDRSIDVLVARLRRKVEADPKAPRLIVTTPGVGYKFAARPRLVPPPDIAEAETATALESMGLSLHPSGRHRVTVLRCAIAGMDALGAALSPEDLRRVVAAFHVRCADVVRRFGGTVAQSDEQGVLGWFGYPQAHGLHAEPARRAALALAEAVRTLPTGLAAPLRAEIGIAAGVVMIGDLAAEQRDQGRH